MKPSMLMLLALASCAYGTNEVKEVASPVEGPKPAIREQIVPGTTYGNAALQAETVVALKTALASDIEHAGCPGDQTKVSDTWAPNAPTQSEFSSAFLNWSELWTVDVCGSSLDFEVGYMRHTTGIINVSVSQQKNGHVLVLN